MSSLDTETGRKKLGASGGSTKGHAWVIPPNSSRTFAWRFVFLEYSFWADQKSLVPGAVGELSVESKVEGLEHVGK